MEVTDTLLNLTSGLGTGKDKTTDSRFGFRPVLKYELDQAYEGDWLAGAIVDCPCDDMTREWRRWQGGPRQAAAMEQVEHKLKARERVNLALKQARLYGGSAILIGDGAPDPREPLDPANVKRGGILYLHNLSRYEIWAAMVNRDPFSPFFGEPEYYTVASPGTNVDFSLNPLGAQAVKAREAGAVFVHPSRVVRFLGQARLELTRSLNGWGLSTLQRVYDAVRNVAQTAGNMAAMTNEAKVDVIKIPNLTMNVSSADYREKLTQRFSLANMQKSINNMLLLDAQESWEQKSVAFQHFPEVLRLFLEIAAGAADVPLTRLLGTSPKGMNATGESDVRNYYDSLAARQRVEVGPALERLDEVLIRSALGTRPANLEYSWNSLWQIKENEEAALTLQRAQTDQIYATMAAMPPSALRAGITAKLVENRTYPGLGDALDVAKAAGEVPEQLVAPAAVKPAEIDAPSARGAVAKD